MKVSVGNVASFGPSSEQKRQGKSPRGAKNAAVLRAEAAARANTGDGLGGVKHYKLVGFSVLAQESADKPRL